MYGYIFSCQHEIFAPKASLKFFSLLFKPGNSRSNGGFKKFEANFQFPDT